MSDKLNSFDSNRVGRLRFLMGILLTILGLFVVQTFRIQIVEGERYATAIEGQSIRREVIAPERGSLFDRRGQLLAGNAEFKTVVRGRERKLQRLHPWRNVGAVVLGTLGSTGSPLMGLEMSLDRELRGLEGWSTWRNDARGRKVNQVQGATKSAVAGLDVVLTIDKELQELVEGALHEGVEAVEGSRGVAIVLEPYTGEIMAMAVYPGFDPDDHTSLTPEKIRNDAITMLHEPGSVVKALTAAAALEENLISPKDTFDVSSGFYEIRGEKIRDSHKMGKLSFADAIAKSSNVAFAQISERLGEKKLYQYLRSFGLGMRTGISLPGEEKGVLKQVHEWSGRTLPTLAMGHELLVTPLQMVMAYGAIANGGLLMKPRLVREFRDSETGELVRREEPEEMRRVISPETAARLRHEMVGVVQPGGTASNIYDPRFSVCGKTGTAEKYDPIKRRYQHNVNTASFIGMFPADRPELVVYAMVDEPKINSTSGGRVAGPIFKTIVQRIRYAPILDGGVAVAVRSEGKEANLVGLKADSLQRLCRSNQWNCLSHGKGNRVVWQQPAAGTLLNPGETVRVGWSRPQIETELEGWPLRDAVELLERRGYTVEWEGYGRVQGVELVDASRCRLILQEAT